MKKATIFIVLLATLTALGSVYLARATPYVVFTVVCVISVSIALNKINAKYVPVYIYGLGLALLWQTSMLGTWIVGVDIHNEYSVVQQSIANGWNTSWADGNNSSAVLGGIAPALAKLGFNPVWQFKALYPAIYACAPVLLYYVYRKMVGDTRAYFAVLFVMIMPMFSMEMVSMTKSLVAQTLLAAMLWCIFCSKASNGWKAVGAIGAAVGAIVCHYSVGLMIAMYLAGTLVVLVIFRRWLGRPNPRLLGVVTLAVVILCLGYYSWFGGGFMLRTFVATGQSIARTGTAMVLGSEAPKGYLDRTQPEGHEIAKTQTTNAQSTNAQTTTTQVTDTQTTDTQVTDTQTAEARTTNDVVSTKRTYLEYQEPLVRTAIGLDWNTASNWGKSFRTLQYLTELLLVVGFFCMLRKKYNFTAEYKALVAAGFGVLALCILVPFFSTTVSATRFYMTALMFIAPMLVIGGEGIIDFSTRLLGKVR